MSEKHIERSYDPASQKMIKKAEDENIQIAWDRYDAMQPQCGFGQLGICCRICSMGPCRIDPFGEGPQEGVCGAGSAQQPGLASAARGRYRSSSRHHAGLERSRDRLRGGDSGRASWNRPVRLGNCWTREVIAVLTNGHGSDDYHGDPLQTLRN